MQGLGRIRFFGLQIRFYLLFYLRVRCLFRIALELCNYRAVFTYQVKLRNSATSLIIIYKFSYCFLIGSQKTVFYSLIFHIGFARRLRPSPRFYSQHLKLVHCIFFFNLFKKGIEILHGPQPIPVNCNKMTFDFIPLKETF